MASTGLYNNWFGYFLAVPLTIGFEESTYTVSETDGTVTLRIVPSGMLTTPLSLAIGTVDGTAGTYRSSLPHNTNTFICTHFHCVSYNHFLCHVISIMYTCYSTIFFAVIDSTDYTPPPPFLLLFPQQASLDIIISITSDDLDEVDETFSVVILSIQPPNADPSPARTTVTIIDGMYAQYV